MGGIHNDNDTGGANSRRQSVQNSVVSSRKMSTVDTVHRVEKGRWVRGDFVTRRNEARGEKTSANRKHQVEDIVLDDVRWGGDLAE